MKIIVIGSKGFIGSHCVNYFNSLGYQVIGCDLADLTEPNYAPFSSLKNGFSSLFINNDIDFCINSAGSANVGYSYQNPETDFEMNVSLVINLLGAIKNNCPKCKFINFSSAAVYGNPTILPIKEDTVTKPLSPYGYHKMLSENLLLEYFRFFNLKTCSLRVFSAYGEGLKKQLFWDLYTKSKQSNTISLFGTGFESRDFIYIKDLITIVELTMKNAKFEGEVYNVANGEEIFVNNAASIFFKELDWTGNIEFSGKEKIGDPVNWKADILKIQELGYVQKYNFNDGMKRTCKWLKSLK